MVVTANEERTAGPSDLKTPPNDDRLLVKWLEGQPALVQKEFTQRKVKELLDNASQPRHASENACIKLCYFIEQCRSSTSVFIRSVVFSEEICLQLFSFYIEWSEKNQNRSMRQVLELLSSLIANNPNKEVSAAVKSLILSQTLGVITHDSIQPAVKPSFKLLECFLGKGSITPIKVLVAYKTYLSQKNGGSLLVSYNPSEFLENNLVSSIFFWLGPADVSPAAGKFLVTLFKTLRVDEYLGGGTSKNYSVLWQRWIRQGIAKIPLALENVKNYLLTPLFKLDRAGSLTFLKDLNKQSSIINQSIQELDAHAMLQLAAMDAGKKAGLIEEPNPLSFPHKITKSKKGLESIILDEQAIGALLSNPANDVRSLALSVLITSFSSTRPFSLTVLGLLKSHMGFFHSDTDAKFRNDVISNTKHLIERLKGTTAFMVRELEHLSFQLTRPDQGSSPREENDKAVHDAIQSLVIKHEQFIEWYVEFNFNELVPTASYQRHITALRAIQLLLDSQLQCKEPGLVLSGAPATSALWPLKMEFFDSQSMRLLLDLLMDPFADVRTSAMDILRLCTPSKFAGGSEHLSLSNGEVMKNVGNALYTTMTSTPLKENDSHLPSKSVNQHSFGLLTSFITKANVASMNSGRADYADGVAKGYKLLHSLQISLDDAMSMLDNVVADLETKIEVAERDLAQAVHSIPVHGSFAALSYICESVTSSLDPSNLDHMIYWKRWSLTQLRIISLATRIWNAVWDVLCNDSPEGHLPQELDDIDAVDTKDVLSYSFRAVHESSNLMRILADTLKQPWPEEFAEAITDTFTQIGNLSFTQLSTLRHRGAFSTVALTFSRCCQLTQNPKIKSYSSIALRSPSSKPTNSFQAVPTTELLSIWWKGALKSIMTQASTTRRSAGIPVLMTGLMLAMKEANLEYSISELARQAQVPVSPQAESVSELRVLPQVHALNSIRQAFKTSSLRNRLDSSVDSCLELAAECFGSDVWPIKNCGLLLFQTLTDFLLGTETKEQIEHGWGGHGTKVSFDRYPKVWSVLMSLLENSSQKQEDSSTIFSTVEKTIPVLDILRRAGSPEKDLQYVYNLVQRHLDSKSWHVRDLAARTLCALSPVQELKSIILQLQSLCGQSANRTHGALLAIANIISRHVGSDGSSEAALVDDLCDLFAAHFFAPSSADDPPSVVSAYMEAGNVILESILLKTMSNTADSILASGTGVNRMNSYSQYGQREFSNKLLATFPMTLSAEAMSAVKSWQWTTDLSFQLIARRALYIFRINGQIYESTDLLMFVISKNESAALVAIKAFQIIWKLNMQETVDSVMYQFYTDVVRSPTATSVRTVGLEGLSDLVSSYDNHELLGVSKEVLETGKLFYSGARSPELSMAWVKFSGNQAYISLLRNLVLNEAVSSWGWAILSCLEDDKAYEMRLAATSALQSFYKRFTHEAANLDYLLPSLFAVYTALNDDEEEVRILGARVVAKITGDHMAPPAAADSLRKWMANRYRTSNLFAQAVTDRIFGSSYASTEDEGEETSAANVRKTIESSFVEDDELFAVESQNLWIDQAGEAMKWSKVFGELSPDIFQNDATALQWIVSYATIGLEILVHILKKREDGAFGWSSRPEAFTSCTRIICCANTILTYLGSVSPSVEKSIKGHVLEGDFEKMKALLNIFLSEAQGKSFNEQLLLLLLGEESLARTKLHELLLERVALMVDKSPYLRGQRLIRK